MKRLLLAALSVLLGAAALCGCADEGLGALVSEYRSAVWYAETENASLQAEFSKREYPYAADGIASETSDYFEVRAELPDSTLTYTLTFTAGGKEWGGEMNYDSVRREFSYSVSMPAPSEETIDFTVAAEGEGAPSYTFRAQRSAGKLSLDELLASIQKTQAEALKEFAGEKFTGEIYVRYAPRGDRKFFYSAFIGRDGRTLSFLADADTGEVLASRLQP